MAGKLKDIGEGIVGAFLIGAALLTPFLRPWRSRWGSTDDEVHRSWPSDELVPHPKWQWTHAVTIRASAAEVWPWVVQMGQGRGGFYSYEWLENLFGCNIHNVNRIIPEFQHLEIGDSIQLHPKAPGLPVAIVEPARALVLHAGTWSPTENMSAPTDMMSQSYVTVSWAFLLDELDQRATRLISRWRANYKTTLANRLGYGPSFVEPIGFVMDLKMLLGIKQRAEAVAQWQEV